MTIAGLSFLIPFASSVIAAALAAVEVVVAPPVVAARFALAFAIARATIACVRHPKSMSAGMALLVMLSSKENGVR